MTGVDVPIVGATAKLKNLTYLNEAEVFVRTQVPMVLAAVLTFVALVEAAEIREWKTLNPVVVTMFALTVPVTVAD
jgi:hypothetical protein